MNSFNTQRTLAVNGKNYFYHSLSALQEAGLDISKLPFSLKILLENLLRYEDGITIKKEDIASFVKWNPQAVPDKEIMFMPARVILQDFTGVPAVADLAAMRRAIKQLGGDPAKINPYTPADLVIDHSVQVDFYGSENALGKNTDLEFERNRERYQFLRWGQQAFNNFRVVPPGNGIVHQVNLEFLAPVAMISERNGEQWVYPDSVLGTDSHTTMINGLGVLGWGVGGIEAEAALLGQPSSMLIPQVVGFKLVGAPKTGITATDIVLTVTQVLRKHGVVGKFVEFFGPGLAQLSLADRATIANMAPEYGATIGLFPIDERTVEYLKLTGREESVAVVEAYFKAQGLWYSPNQVAPIYSQEIVFDLAGVEPSMAGPARPQDRVSLSEARGSFRKFLISHYEQATSSIDKEALTRWLTDGGTPNIVSPEFAADHPDAHLSELGNSAVVRQPDGLAYKLCHGSIVIAAITSCTNTSNPAVLIAAGLVAKKAVQRGLQTKPWVKTSLAPGSRVVTSYLTDSGLMPYLEALRFHHVGYGCTTCIGNSGPFPDHITTAIQEGDLAVAAVLSGNRNFEGRVNAQVRANYLASPPLVVAYALAGNINIDLTRDSLGLDSNGTPVYLADIWPTREEIDMLVQQYIIASQYKRNYADVFAGSDAWNKLEVPSGETYQWAADSTYIKEPPFFDNMSATPKPLQDLAGARVLAMFGDSITTDHISPAGSIKIKSPAGEYLLEHGVDVRDFNSYGARRGNHEVMVRGTFANIRLKNRLVPGTEGGITKHVPSGQQMPIFDAAMRYAQDNVPLVIIAGKEYGTGSSRDWAAKGPQLLGVKAVIVESFERIHRSNLVGMGILPLQFMPGENQETLQLTGEETLDIAGVVSITPQQTMQVQAKRADGSVKSFTVIARIDTPNEIEYFRHGGILPYVLRQAVA